MPNRWFSSGRMHQMPPTHTPHSATQLACTMFSFLPTGLPAMIAPFMSNLALNVYQGYSGCSDAGLSWRSFNSTSSDNREVGKHPDSTKQHTCTAAMVAWSAWQLPG